MIYSKYFRPAEFQKIPEKNENKNNANAQKLREK